MQKLRKFSKYHGAGNDFIFFEDFDETFPQARVSTLCHRHFGIGADGLILVRQCQVADFEMVYFNADGSKGAMCGNGLRCFVHFLRDCGKIQSQYQIAVSGKVLTVKADGAKILTILPEPRVLHWDIQLHPHTIFVVDTGVPHAVIFAEGDVDVKKEGKRLCEHLHFQPEGVNVNFVQIHDEKSLSLRTYERGVGNETLACGTGAAAVAFVAHHLQICREEIEVATRSKEVLKIRVRKEIEVQGPSMKVFDGQIMI